MTVITASKLQFKRGTYTYDNEQFKCYDIIKDGVKVGFIEKDDDLNEWFAWPDMDSEYICGGLTLAEVKETLQRIL